MNKITKRILEKIGQPALLKQLYLDNVQQIQTFMMIIIDGIRI